MFTQLFVRSRQALRLVMGVAGLALCGLLAIVFLAAQDHTAFAMPRAVVDAQQLAIHKTRAQPVAFPPRTDPTGIVEEFDTLADEVYGQPDFTSGAVPTDTNALTLHQPADVFVFDTGQIFIADTENNRVLGWDSVDLYENGDPADLVLGQPDFTSSGAPNPPTINSMRAPTGITVGYDGIMYVSDTGNNRILVFVPWNICDFYEYYDDIWCIEEDGYEFSDSFWPEFTNGMDADYVIGQPDFVTSIAAPTSRTSLNQPMGLVTDINDNLVVADHGNNRVLIYEWPFRNGLPASRIVGQTVNGLGIVPDYTASEAPDPPTAVSLNAPTSVAAGILGTQIYVADTGNHRVLVYNDAPADGRADAVIGQPDFVSNTPGLGPDKFDNPTGLKLDAGNRLFVADTNNHRILLFDQLNPDGQADDIFGQPDYNSNTPNSGGISDASLSAPTGIATDATFMDVYIADRGNNRVLQYNQPLPNPVPDIAELDPNTVLAGTGSITIDLWGSGIIAQTVVEVNGVQRATGSDFLGLTRFTLEASDLITTTDLTITLRNPAPGGGLSTPVILTVYEPQVGDTDADYVLGQKGFATNDGEFTRVTASSLDRPTGVVVDLQTGRLFVADLRNARVLSWPSSATRNNGQPADLVLGQPDFETWGANPAATLGTPTGLALDSQGTLYVSDALSNAIRLFAPPFTNGMTPTHSITGLRNPLGLLVDDQDNLYVADSGNHRVLVYEGPVLSRDSMPDRVYGQPNFDSAAPNQGGAITADTLNFPTRLAMDKAGNLYVVDTFNHRVLVYLAGDDGDTTADIVFGQGDSFSTGTPNNGGVTTDSLNFPFGVAVDAAGTLYVADTNNHRLLLYTQPFITDRTADAVFGQNGSFTANQPNNGGRSRSTLHEPIDLALADDGFLFVADRGNQRILVFQMEPIETQPPDRSLYLPVITR
ncbi:MAG: NHL repeat-containing protein [Caldilineaceae bacterium]|nr:NHL repeat-containing protein [Caldilineaceae bacterium]